MYICNGFPLVRTVRFDESLNIIISPYKVFNDHEMIYIFYLTMFINKIEYFDKCWADKSGLPHFWLSLTKVNSSFTCCRYGAFDDRTVPEMQKSDK